MSVTAGVVRFFYEVRVPHFLAFCVVSCFFCSMLPVCLNCSFLIAPSVFSNRYSWQLENTQVVNTLKSCIYYLKNLCPDIKHAFRSNIRAQKGIDL